jgi:hypothetical protein
MPNTNLAAVEAAIKEHYSGGVEDLNGNVSPTLKKVEVGEPEELNSRGAALVIRPQNNAIDRFSTAEFGDYPAPGNSPLVKTTVTFINHTKSALFSHHVLAENMLPSKITDVVTGQLDNCLEFINETKNINLWGDGSGERARVSGVAGLVITCNNAGNLYGVQLLDVGMEVEFRDSGGTLIDATVPRSRITAINEGTPSFTVDIAPAGLANNHRVYLYGSFNAHPRGFLYHITNSGAWQGLSDRTIYRGTSPAIQAAGGAILSAGLMDKTTSGSAFKRGTRAPGKQEYYVSSQWDAYLAIGYDMKIVEGQTFDAGYKTFSHGGKAFNWDPHVQRDFVWDLDVSQLKEFRMKKMEMVKNDSGGYLHLMTAGQGQGRASGRFVFWEGFYNYGTKSPVKLGTRISGLSTSGLELGNNT